MRSSLSSPEKLRRELARVRSGALELAYLAQKLAGPYEEGYDASLSPFSTGGIQPGRKGFVPSDPTGDTAISSMHKGARYKVKLAARRVQRAIDEIELAQGDMFELFVALDPADPHRQVNRG